LVAREIFAAWLDGSSKQLRELLDELEGVSEETLERIDFVSRPTKDGPIPRFPDEVQLYERLVLLALTEASLHGQRAKAKKAKAA
jgi:hypothetical protein